MTAVDAALLGIVQGLTEFLPISSSAHLILARTVLGGDVGQLGLAFDVACHVGTLLAVIVFFRVELTEMGRAIPAALGTGGGPAAVAVRLIAVGTVPIVCVGLAFGDVIERSMRTPAVSLAMLALGGVVLLAAERWGSTARGEGSLSLKEALAIGAAQATALVPGVSRAGATIAVSMMFGLRREAAARFSFLLGVPAIMATAVGEMLKLLETGLDGAAVQLLAIGVTVSAIVGYLTIKYFLQYLVRHSLIVFALYRLGLAGLGGALLIG